MSAVLPSIHTDKKLKLELNRVFPLFSLIFYLPLLLLVMFSSFYMTAMLLKYKLGIVSESFDCLLSVSLIISVIVMLYIILLFYTRFHFRKTVYRVEDTVLYCIDPKLDIRDESTVFKFNALLDTNIWLHLCSKYRSMLVNICNIKNKKPIVLDHFLRPITIIYFKPRYKSNFNNTVLTFTLLFNNISFKRILFIDSYVSKHKVLGEFSYKLARLIRNLAESNVIKLNNKT